MIRTQISLDDEQMEALRALARRRGVSLAALLRQAVDALLADPTPGRRQRARDVAGRFRSGHAGRTSEDHDDAVADAFSA
ncbi:MAG: CopG family transcriptional regulator [Acidimicrobiia bacterium]